MLAERLEVQRLQQPDGPDALRLRLQHIVVVAGEHDEAGAGVQRQRELHEVQAVELRQADVGEQRGHTMCGELRPRFPEGRTREHREALARQPL